MSALYSMTFASRSPDRVRLRLSASGLCKRAIVVFSGIFPVRQGGRGLVAFAASLLSLLALCAGRAVDAQEGVTWENGNFCVRDYQSGAVCTAGDTRVISITVQEVIEPCTFPGDTGTITVRTVTDSTATTRYDLAWFIATDGGSARDGDACFHEHLNPVAPGAPPVFGNPTNPLGTGPFANFDGDQCADYSNTGDPIFVTEQITFDCRDSDANGLVDPVSICTSYDNNASNDNGLPACNIKVAYPGTPSKCYCELLQIGGFVVPPFELSLTKNGPTSLAPGETGTYVIEFWNAGDGPGGADPQAFNAVFEDILPLGLTALGRGQSASPGDNITCTTQSILFPEGRRSVIRCTPGNDAAVTPPNGIMDEHKPGVEEHKYSVTIIFRADVGFEQQTLTNEACVDANNNDPNNPPTTPLDVTACDQVTTTTPVTLSSFEATPAGDDAVQFEWSTATEVGNVGFNLYVERGDERNRLNEELIPSQNPSSLVPLDYEFFVNDVDGERFWIASVDIQGEEELRGPFDLGETHGRRSEPARVDWETIRAEKDAVKAAKKAERAAKKAAKKQTSLLSQLASTDSRTRGGKRKDASIATATTASTSVDLMVSRSGLYRVSAGELLAAGFDLKSVPTDQIALWRGGVPRPLRVVGDGDAIEFYGEAADTLYTDTARYTLGVAENPSRVIEDSTRPKTRITPPAYYQETVKIEKELEYSFIAPNGDPFYEAMLLAYGSPAVRTVSLPVDHYVSADNAPLPTLSVGLWGLTDWQDVEPDHRVTLSFNDRELTTEEFDGTVSHPVDVQLAADLVEEGSNALTVTVTGDTGARWDMVALDDYSLTYARAFVAREGRLSFGIEGARTLRVDGLPSPDLVVYRYVGGFLTRMTNVLVKRSGVGYSATFAGSDKDATYLVSTVDALLEPASIEVPLELTDIKGGSAQYLIIAHGAFVDGLGDLVEARKAQGLTVKVVDVAQIYAQFGSEVIDPPAIRNYIAYAAHNLGTQSVLLVGGDCYDYLNHLDTGCVSFIPSFYDKTDPVVDFAPVDPKYADIDGDGVPDVDIGRFPVSTSQELGWMIEKTLAYEDDLGSRSAMFVADTGFGADSDGFLDLMSDALTAEKVYLDVLPVMDARDQLLAGLNDGGLRYVSFVGHSGPRTWTFSGLLTDSDAAALTNEMPMVVNQWGCWNTYYVDPTYDTMGHAFTVAGERGAAAVMGSTTISYANTEKALGDLMSPRLAAGMSIGAALTEAKQELARQHPEMKDVILGWTILGDPTLQVVPASE